MMIEYSTPLGAAGYALSLFLSGWNELFAREVTSRTIG